MLLLEQVGELRQQLEEFLPLPSLHRVLVHDKLRRSPADVTVIGKRMLQRTSLTIGILVLELQLVLLLWLFRKSNQLTIVTESVLRRMLPLLLLLQVRHAHLLGEFLYLRPYERLLPPRLILMQPPVLRRPNVPCPQLPYQTSLPSWMRMKTTLSRSRHQ